MTIQALGASPAYGALSQVGGGAHRPQGPPPARSFDNTAQLLGLSPDDLKSKMTAGQTLSSIAKDNGVANDDLLASIKKDLQANRPAGAPELSDDQLTHIVSDIAAGKGPGGPGRGGAHGIGGSPPSGHNVPGASASDPSQALQSLADALGTTTDDLLSQMQSGTDLSSLFGASGSATWSSQGGTTGGLSVDYYA